jgi:hypothetical protein
LLSVAALTNEGESLLGCCTAPALPLPCVQLPGAQASSDPASSGNRQNMLPTFYQQLYQILTKQAPAAACTQQLYYAALSS